MEKYRVLMRNFDLCSDRNADAPSVSQRIYIQHTVSIFCTATILELISAVWRFAVKLEVGIEGCSYPC